MRITLWSAVISSVLLNCGPPRAKIEIGGFDFEYEGKRYRIESVAPNFIQGYNTLLRREGNRLVLRAIDKEQDSVLDDVIIGDISLEKAREIYQGGLEIGEKRGYIRRRYITREYKTTIDRDNLTLVTYMLALGELYNKLVIRDNYFRESIIIDQEADGILDKVDKGDDNLGSYQRLYKKVLDKGVREGRVVKTDGRYLVILN